MLALAIKTPMAETAAHMAATAVSSSLEGRTTTETAMDMAKV